MWYVIDIVSFLSSVYVTSGNAMPKLKKVWHARKKCFLSVFKEKRCNQGCDYLTTCLWSVDLYIMYYMWIISCKCKSSVNKRQKEQVINVFNNIGDGGSTRLFEMLSRESTEARGIS